MSIFQDRRANWILTSGSRNIRELSGWQEGFLDGQSYPSEETARKIWDAAKEFQYGTGAYDKNPYPDFETFYKTLIEGK